MITARRLLPFLFLAVLCATPCAQSRVRQQLDALSLEHKAGQLFVSWSLARPGNGGKNHEQLLRWVEEVGLGGVILSLGTVEDAATLIPKLQAKAKVPLLLAGDFEGGVWFRLRGGTELGNQMLFGATGSARLTEMAGRVTGEEAKALGFHWVFAPVLDVNSNPGNPIINVRSFSEDPQLVAKLGSAFARGVRQAGLIACGKHFPGHGDVDTDSHLALATVPGDGQRLREVELLPFAAAAREGLESVMTGHLAVPGLGERKDVPATLSRLILGDVLRKELGFTGLVVTDALDMGGVKNAFPPGEVAVRALLAGADVLLMPPDPLVARQAVVDAVKSGRLPMARLDDAVRRILEMKQRVGLLDGRGMTAPDWRDRVMTKESLALSNEIARRGLVLLRDRGEALASFPKEGRKGLLVTLVDKEEGQGERFREFLADAVDERPIRLTANSSDAEVEAAVARARQAEHVVVALFTKVRESHGGPGLAAPLLAFCDGLRDEQNVVAVSFGSPYIARHLDVADALMLAFGGHDKVQVIAVRAMLGHEVSGRLPVRIPGVADAFAGLTRGRVKQRTPLASGLDIAPDLPAALEVRLQQAVTDKAFPGAVCMVTRRGREVARLAVGRVSYDAAASAVTPETPYDLASLTKVCATTPAILHLVSQGKLSLDDPVQKWVPQFVGAGKDEVTVRHLMAHQGGLPAYVRYFRSKQGKDAIVAAAATEGLMLEPGTTVRYSDLGFVLLMAVVEAVSGQSFDEFCGRMWRRLGMRDSRFVPTSGEPWHKAAPTERDSWRGELVHGFVHDENAYAMGGVSGHAGMFSTARDISRYGWALLGSGRGVIARDVVLAATRPAGISADTTRGLGFQLLRSGTWAGSDVPAGTFGHTGFTGTSLWCSPRYDVVVVLLTNRVHPTRVNSKITAVRRAVHDLVLDALRRQG